jgi:hypothetical protein
LRPSLAVLLLCLARLGGAAAHELNLSTLYVTVEGRKVDTVMGVLGGDAGRMAGRELMDPQSGLVDPAKLDAATPALTRYLAEHLTITGGNGVACVQAQPLLGPDYEGGVLAEIGFDCSKTEGGLLLRSTVMPAIDPAGRQALIVNVDGEEKQLPMLDREHREVSLTPRR